MLKIDLNKEVKCQCVSRNWVRVCPCVGQSHVEPNKREGKDIKVVKSK